MRYTAAVLLLLCAAPGAAFAQTPAAKTATTTAGYKVDSTTLGVLFDDPAAKAVLDKHLPGFTANPQLQMARSLTLKDIQQYAPDKFSDKLLADIQTDLSALPAKK